jgi:hypothetical protein
MAVRTTSSCFIIGEGISEFARKMLFFKRKERYHGRVIFLERLTEGGRKKGGLNELVVQVE